MTTRQAIFRADASHSIGTGHVVRCRTLATGLIARGWTAAIASRDLPEGLARSLAESGVAVIPLEPGMSLDGEADAIAAAIDSPATLLVADHYELGTAWYAAMRGRARVLMGIDDLADRAHPVDLMLNQNLGAAAASYRDLVPAGARVLAGPRYALVRPEFAQRRLRRRVRDGRIERILVFISGADANNVTARAVEALMDLDVSVDIVVGLAYADLARLRAQVGLLKAAEIHVNVDTMAELMDRADLAIGAPSSASWERCTLGLPTVLVVLTDNQVTVGRELVASGAAVSVGWHATVGAAAIQDIVGVLRADPDRVMAMSRAAAGVTDGHGTQRVIEAIEDVARAVIERP